MTGISKRFPGVTALDSVDIDAGRGEVLALVGENGAGKSTLMKVLAGIHAPDAGSIHIDGRLAVLRSPRDASNWGIGIIHQELELIETLDVAANVFLGREPTWAGPVRLIDSKRIHAETERILERLHAPISPRIEVGRLSLAHKQLVEIARAISLNARLLIMDEPTSSLTTTEMESLFRVITELKAEGISIIYISHRLSEVEAIADRVAVLRDGKNAGTLRRPEIRHDRIVQLMVGRDLHDFYVEPPSLGSRVCLELKNFRTRKYPNSEVALSLRHGEILGVAGLIGAGRTELALAICGVEPPLSGSAVIDGKPFVARVPRDAIERGVYLIPEDRRKFGLITEMNVRENITLPALARYAQVGFIHRAAEGIAARKVSETLRVKFQSMNTLAANLSGGNQQKVVLAKWLALNPKVVVFDEPTRGIDVGGKAEIYQLMRRLANEGVAILMISSDMEEILGNSDRVAVMHDGRITGVLDRSQCSQEAIMRLAVA
jgi:ribose transport system ATP-binding protein